MRNLWEGEDVVFEPEARSPRQGRPLIEGMKGRPVNIYMRYDTEKWLREKAGGQGLSLSTVVNLLIREKMKQEEG